MPPVRTCRSERKILGSGEVSRHRARGTALFSCEGDSIYKSRWPLCLEVFSRGSASLDPVAVILCIHRTRTGSQIRRNIARSIAFPATVPSCFSTWLLYLCQACRYGKRERLQPDPHETIPARPSAFRSVPRELLVLQAALFGYRDLQQRNRRISVSIGGGPFPFRVVWLLTTCRGIDSKKNTKSESTRDVSVRSCEI